MSFKEILDGLRKINVITPTPLLNINTIETLKSIGDIRLVSLKI
jgi:hypothetical protein